MSHRNDQNKKNNIGCGFSIVLLILAVASGPILVGIYNMMGEKKTDYDISSSDSSETITETDEFENENLYSQESSEVIDNTVMSTESATEAVSESIDEIETSSSGETFYSFLKLYYDSADEYCDGNPVHHDSSGDNGGVAWLDFIICDFDGDKENELLIKLAYSKDKTYRTDGDNMYCIALYELVDNKVQFIKEMCFSGNLHDELETCIYDNKVIYAEERDVNVLNLFIFDDSERARLGLADSEYLSYLINFMMVLLIGVIRFLTLVMQQQ